jgi:glycosyltransferase involved in cell wall biosynthesis
LHIVILSEHFHKNPSGPRLTAEALAREFTAAGCKVTILSISPQSSDETLPCGTQAMLRRYRMKILPVKRGRPWYFAKLLARIHKREPVTAVLAAGLEVAAVALKFREWTGVPFVLNPQSGLGHAAGEWKFDRAKDLMRECNAFIGLSEFEVKNWCGGLGIERGPKHHAIHNGVDGGFLEGPEYPTAKIPPGVPLILCLGMLRRVKGQHLVMQGLTRILDKPWHMVLAGDGKERSMMLETRTELDLEGRVAWPGMVLAPERNWLYRNADIFCLTPIYPEAFGLVFLEAQLAGLPVISTKSGAIPEVVVDGETGILLEPDDNLPDAIAAALTRLLDDPELGKRMGAAGRERALQFTWPKAAGRYLAVLKGGA